MKENKTLGEVAINNAISYWIRRKNGIITAFDRWCEDEQVYTEEYCEEQIQYFKKLKL